MILLQLILLVIIGSFVYYSISRISLLSAQIITDNPKNDWSPKVTFAVFAALLSGGFLIFLVGLGFANLINMLIH